jgi:hypothetical protein
MAAYEHDRHGPGCLQQYPGIHTCVDEDHVWHEGHQLSRRSLRAFGIACVPPVVDPHIAVDGPAQLLEVLQEDANAA